MKRKSHLVLLTGAACLALLKLPAHVLLNLGLGSLAIAFSGWLVNRRRVSKATRTARLGQRHEAASQYT